MAVDSWSAPMIPRRAAGQDARPRRLDLGAPGGGREAGPALEAVAPRRVGGQAGGDAPRQQCRLDDDGAGAAQRVDQRHAAIPAAGQEQGRGQVFAQRRGHVGAPVAARMQAVAAGIEPDVTRPRSSR